MAQHAATGAGFAAIPGGHTRSLGLTDQPQTSARVRVRLAGLFNKRSRLASSFTTSHPILFIPLAFMHCRGCSGVSCTGRKMKTSGAC